MIYLLETSIIETKPIFIALQNIYGINIFYSSHICKKLGVSFNYKIKNLSLKQKTHLIKIMNNYNLIFSSKLKLEKTLAEKTLVDLKTYRGLRKLQGFPVRGQRTRSNAKTSKKLKKVLK